MQEHYFILKNGLKVQYIQRPESNIVSCILATKVGALIEGENEVGLAHFCEHVVLKSTEQYPSRELLNKLIADTGGYSNGLTSYTYTKYPVHHSKEYIDNCLMFLSETVFHPLIAEEDVSIEKSVILQEIRKTNSEKNKIINKTFLKLLFNNRFSSTIIGEEEKIEKYTTLDIRNFYEKWYKPNNFWLTIVADLPLDKIQEKVSTYFEKVPINTKNSSIVYAIEKLPITENTDIRIPANIDGSYVMIVGDIIDSFSEDEIPFVNLLNFVLSNNKTGRLYKLLRVQEKKVYHVSSENVPYGDNCSTLRCITECAEVDTEYICNKIKEEYNKIFEYGITEEELTIFKLEYIVSNNFNEEKSSDIADVYTSYSLKRNKPLSKKERNEKYQSLSLLEVNNFLKKLKDINFHSLVFHKE